MKTLYVKKIKDIEKYCSDFRNELQEHLVCFHFTYDYRLLSREIIAKGTSMKCYSCQKEIMRSALKHNAYNMTIIHNHPEENRATFSDADFQNAWNIKAIGLFFDMNITYLVITKKHIKKMNMRKELKKKPYKKMIKEICNRLSKYKF